MSEGFTAPPPPTPEPGRRPATVTVAGLLMLVVALCSVIYLVASLAVIGAFTDLFAEAFAGTDAEGSEGVLATVSVVLPSVAYLLIAVTLLILTVFNNRGRNGSRIATWIVGGVAACCCGINMLSTAFTDLGAAGTGSPDFPDAGEIERLYSEHVPGWYDPTTITVIVVSLLALVVALILLALPASNEFFRRRPEPEPPTPGYPPVG
jgi:amino acid transporter